MELIRIRAVSPAYDSNWFERDELWDAADHVREWIARHGMVAEVVQLPGRTPLVVAEAGGRDDRGTVVVYGHLDTVPSPGFGRWRAVLRDGRLYGRGAADDGYAGYAAVTALAVSRDHERTVLLLETGAESGSPDLDVYLTALAGRLGDVSLVIGLDGAAAGYERWWLTTRATPDSWLLPALAGIGARVFGRPCGVAGADGGGGPADMLARRYPDARHVVTGAAGPDSNTHARDESLNLAYAYRVTESLALLLEAHARG
ncbi:M20/M25/M40 family metallo-hydrolase [Actinoplanes sp. TBRC 11911]|nr:M20/M25/M40 family metallo-hydrolase [Actinoplanes sp. TBRC 11911]